MACYFSESFVNILYMFSGADVDERGKRVLDYLSTSHQMMDIKKKKTEILHPTDTVGVLSLPLIMEFLYI